MKGVKFWQQQWDKWQMPDHTSTCKGLKRLLCGPSRAEGHRRAEQLGAGAGGEDRLEEGQDKGTRRGHCMNPVEESGGQRS